MTLKITVQLPLAGIVMLLKFKAVAPAVSGFGVVPTQVPVTLPPAALMLVSVSVNAPPVSAVDALLLVSVRVTVDTPPDGMLVGLKALEMVGAVSAFTVKLTILLPDRAAGVCVVVTPEVLLG